MSLNIHTFFDEKTATFSYIVFDVCTKKALIIDSVLDYDSDSGKTNTYSADILIEYIKSNNLELEWILETHIHADHLTAATYIKNTIGGKIGIGGKITEVLAYWVPLFNSDQDTPVDGSQFDHLFENNETFALGALTIQVMHTPGHTPACCSYLIGDAVFVGDTVFMPDVGTARIDFPGGGAEALYDSIQRIFSLPAQTRIFTGHDYPKGAREVCAMSTVREQRLSNILIRDEISKEKYIELRCARDRMNTVPKLLLPSLQVNLRGGSFGQKESNGYHYIKIPVNAI